MLTGVTLGSGVATSLDSQRVNFSLIKITKSVSNLAELAGENKHWRQTAQLLRPKGGAVGHRAQFADDVLAAAIENVRHGVGDVIVAQAVAGSLLGVATYIVDAKEGFLNLLATAPEFVPGAGPPSGQLRGIGTSIVAAISRDMLARGVETVFLHGLDAAAVEWWTHRGFVSCGLGGLLCVRGRAKIEALRGSCELKPCPDEGDCLFCGRQQDIIAVRVPVPVSR